MAEKGYTPEQVQQALQAGLIKPEDAEYLIGALGPQNSVAGAIGGALLGGAAGGALGKWAGGAAGNALAARESAGAFSKGAGAKADWMPEMTPELLQGNNAAMAGMGLGGLAGGIGGGVGGGMGLASEGMGVGTENPTDMALRVLIDPNSRKEDKQAAAMFLQEQEAAMQAGQGSNKFGPALGATLGAMGGAALGGLGLPALGTKMTGWDKQNGMMSKIGNALSSENVQNYGGLGGMLPGTAGGSLVGSYMDPYSA